MARTVFFLETVACSVAVIAWIALTHALPAPEAAVAPSAGAAAAASSGPAASSASSASVADNKETVGASEAVNSTEAASSSGFSCEGRIFGYYGDTKNCSLFHYCEPFTDPEKNQFVLHAAYLCPNETVFNQLSLTCVYPSEALDCARAPEYYYVNSHVVPVDTSAEQGSGGSGEVGGAGDSATSADSAQSAAQTDLTTTSTSSGTAAAASTANDKGAADTGSATPQSGKKP